MPPPSPETIDLLNALLEDQRASVEIEVALASDATEYGEREALEAMGGEDIAICCALRERMSALGLDVTHRINGVVFQVLGMERYDERLRAFANHQRLVLQRARMVDADTLDRELRQCVEAIIEAHPRHALWCDDRATEFAATREINFQISTGTGWREWRKRQAELSEQMADVAPETETASPLTPAQDHDDDITQAPKDISSTAAEPDTEPSSAPPNFASDKALS